jgi:flagellar hook assembly protein FlgD
LSWAQPNPFHGATDVTFSLAHAGNVDLAVFDVLGREVRSLARGRRFVAGTHRLHWDGRTDAGHDASAGVYFVRLSGDGGHWTRPVVRVR